MAPAPHRRTPALPLLALVLGAGGLAYWAYAKYRQSSRDTLDEVADEAEDELDGQKSGGVSGGKGKGRERQGRKRVGLTIAPDSLESLPQSLLTSLSELYTIHLLLPHSTPPLSADSKPLTPTPAPDQLPTWLTTLPTFDVRRVLYYSKPIGRTHLIRALKCPIHIEPHEPPPSAFKSSPSSSMTHDDNDTETETENETESGPESSWIQASQTSSISISQHSLPSDISASVDSGAPVTGSSSTMTFPELSQRLFEITTFVGDVIVVCRDQGGMEDARKEVEVCDGLLRSKKMNGANVQVVLGWEGVGDTLLED